MIGLSDLMTVFIDLGGLYCIQFFQKHTKLNKNRISRPNVNQNFIDQSVGTSHKALERLALRRTLRFYIWQ
jgi:hypothetical protein